MPSAQMGRMEIFGLGTGFANIAGQNNSTQFVTARALKLEHTTTVNEIKGQDGDVNSIIFSGARLKVDLEYIAQGNNAANAATAAALPNFGATCNLSGFPSINVGGFTDALNSGTAPHIFYYLGGGGVNLTDEGVATHSITLHKFSTNI